MRLVLETVSTDYHFDESSLLGAQVSVKSDKSKLVGLVIELFSSERKLLTVLLRLPELVKGLEEKRIINEDRNITMKACTENL